MISPGKEETKRMNSVVTAPPQACKTLSQKETPQTPKKPEAPAGAGGAVLVKVEDPRHFPTLRWYRCYDQGLRGSSPIGFRAQGCGDYRGV